jgi:HlyD family secretion protein
VALAGALRPGWKSGLLAVFVIGAAALSVRLILGPRVALLQAVRTDFVLNVVASGRIEAPHRVDVGSQITGVVARVPVSEGQFVKANAVLIELESAELDAAVQQADHGVSLAQARLRQVRELQAPLAEQAVLQARINLGNATAQLRRLESLQARGFIGMAALDDARKAADLAAAQVTVATRQLDASSLHGSDQELAQAALAQARATARLARVRAGYAVIAAPVDGTLIARNIEAGDVVQPARVLMTLSPAGRTQIVLAIDEKNLRLLAPGQRAQASADAYPAEQFEALLVYINPGINAQTGAVEVKLDVPRPPPYLRQDMTVSVSIEVARHADAIVIASEALRDADREAPWVLRHEAGRLLRTPIRIGSRSGGHTEVLAGLKEGDRVAPAGAGFHDGDRIRSAPVAASD